MVPDTMPGVTPSLTPPDHDPESTPPPASERPASRDLPVRWRRSAWPLLLALLTGVLWLVAAQFPAWTERWYSAGLYPHIASTLVTLSGWVPFSLAETLLLAGLLAAVLLAGRGIAGVVRRTRRLGNVLARGLCRAVVTASLLFTSFVLLWGLNHARTPFAELVGLAPRPVTRAALLHVLEVLAQRAEAARPPDFDAEAAPPPGWQQAVADAYEAAGPRWPILRGPRPVVRSPWISPLQTMASITGVYSPFTGEPHVNDEPPAPVQWFTAMHEVAHLRGFAGEDEANFIAWWVGSHADDARIAYSCHLQMFRYVRFALFRGFEDGEVLRICAGAPRLMQDARAIERFWGEQERKPLHRAVTQIAQATNDLYLKTAGHEAGLRSYGQVVDLLVAALAE